MPTPDTDDPIEREPPGWVVLPVAFAAIALLLVTFVWLAFRFARDAS